MPLQPLALSVPEAEAEALRRDGSDRLREKAKEGGGGGKSRGHRGKAGKEKRAAPLGR